MAQTSQLTMIPVAAGTELGIVDQARRSRNYRPGWNGMLQHENRGGYHLLPHAGRIEGIVLADYSLQRQIRTQAGARSQLVNVYSVQYMSE